MNTSSRREPCLGAPSPDRSFLSQITEIEFPLTEAAGAVNALWGLVEDGQIRGFEPGIIHLAANLNEAIRKIEEQYDALHKAAGGSGREVLS